jgi:hypothetical protein
MQRPCQTLQATKMEDTDLDSESMNWLPHRQFQWLVRERLWKLTEGRDTIDSMSWILSDLCRKWMERKAVGKCNDVDSLWARPVS